MFSHVKIICFSHVRENDWRMNPHVSKLSYTVLAELSLVAPYLLPMVCRTLSISIVDHG